MSEGIETDKTARDTLGVVIRVLAAQASVLDRMFFRAAKGAVSCTERSLYDARKALKAQARFRATLKILLASGEAWNLQNNWKIERTN